MGVFPQKRPNRHRGEANLRSPLGEELKGDKGSPFSGVSEAVEVKDAGESDEMGCERV